MGMTAHKFGVDGTDDVVDGKMTVLAVDFGCQQDEVEEISEFLADILMIAIIDRGDELFEFGMEIRFQGNIRLTFVPGAALVAEQFPDCAEELCKMARCRCHWTENYRDN